MMIDEVEIGNKEYLAQLVNAVANVILEGFENITIEDVDMFRLGYNKAIDDFAEHIRAYYALKKEMGYVETTYDDLIKYIFELAQQLKERDNK